jgi:uncharacterized protein (TIGR02996 family)
MSRNPELEAMLLAHPHEPGPYLVYADWLKQHHDKHLLDLLCEDASAELAWYDAYARFSWEDPERSGTLPVEVLLEALFVLSPPSELVFGAPDWLRLTDYESILSALAARERPSVRSLHLGDFSFGGRRDPQITSVSIGSTDRLWKALPHLTHLELQGSLSSLGGPSSELHSLRIRSGGLPRQVPQQIGAARWPALERLELWLGDSLYGGDASVDDLQDLLAGEGLPALRDLALANCEFTAELCRVLPSAAVLPRLRSLDLSKGTLTDEGAHALLAHADSFAHLDSLDLDENFLSDEMCAQLASLCKHVILGVQREPAEWDGEPRYFVAVGE